MTKFTPWVKLKPISLVDWYPNHHYSVFLWMTHIMNWEAKKVIFRLWQLICAKFYGKQLIETSKRFWALKKHEKLSYPLLLKILIESAILDKTFKFTKNNQTKWKRKIATWDTLKFKINFLVKLKNKLQQRKNIFLWPSKTMT